MSTVRLVPIIPSPSDAGQVAGHIAQALAAILSSDTPLAHALGHPPSLSPIEPPQFIKQTAEWCNRHDATSFAITVNQCEAVGQLSISRLGDKEGHGRIGYWLASDFWGKGIMSEAFSQALAVARSHGLKAVSGHVPNGNIASERLWLRHGAKSTTTTKGADFTIAL